MALAFILPQPASRVWAQASLAAEDKIDEIPVKLNTGLTESFTVIRDAMIPEQWYYVPDRPRLFVRQAESGPEPDFALIRYQFKDPSNPQALLEGGLLQFAANLAIPPEAISQLTKVIGDKHNIPENKLRLAALPIKQSNVAIYLPKEGELLAEASQGAGIAPTFATQKMVFMVPFTRIGSDVYDELVNGNTGIPVVIYLHL